MGLYLSLNLTPTVAPDEWDRFWCDSLRILQKFPLRLVRASDHKTPYGFQKVWTDNLTSTDNSGEYWEIAGDDESLAFGEPVRIYRDIDYYRQQWNKSNTEKRLLNKDPLFCKLREIMKAEEEDEHAPLCGVQMFNSRTQGYPYHHAIAAVVSLAEHRFPLYALAWGDLRPGGCDAVRRWLSELFSKDILPPICLDAARLWNRIEGACGNISTTMRRFEERFLGTTAQQIHRMLAESQEKTMQKLAEDLLWYDTITLGFRDLSKSFLEATDDLELFLDLIDLRNSLASKKKIREKSPAIINGENVLKMLVKGFVTYSQWQGEEIRTLRRWVELEGGIVQTINSVFLKMSIPDFFEYYCSESDLLETFVRREPSKSEKFNQVLQVALDANQESEEMIKDFVRSMQERAEAHAKSSKVTNNSKNPFASFMKDEAYLQSGLPERLTKKNVAALGRYCGFHANQMQQMISGMDASEIEEGVADCLIDPTGNKQRSVLLGVIQQQDIRLLEGALLTIERTNDGELLKLFATIAPFLFTEQFRMVAPLLFGEGFETVRPVLWHLMNKPNWWQIFREHRNDGLSEGDPEK
jgi:hypothetical protein